MGPKRSDTNAGLSADQADAVCRKLVPIGATVFDLIDQLERAGFSAFVPAMQLPESFCQGDGDLEAHRRYIIERAKERLGRPFPYKATPEERSRFYRSPCIQNLIAERDRVNGVPEGELTSRYPGEIWRREVDVCQRNLALYTIREPVAFNERSQAIAREQQQTIAREASRYSCHDVGGRSFDDLEARYELFWEIMTSRAGTLGFQFDSTKSKSGCPIFSKMGGGDWDLCWIIEDSQAFFRGPTVGSLNLSLELRPRGLAGRISDTHPRQCLIFAYQHIIPAFLVAYRRFVSFGELALVIEAHLSLYALIAGAVEAAVKDTFGEMP